MRFKCWESRDFSSVGFFFFHHLCWGFNWPSFVQPSAAGQMVGLRYRLVHRGLHGQLNDCQVPRSFNSKQSPNHHLSTTMLPSLKCLSCCVCFSPPAQHSALWPHLSIVVSLWGHRLFFQALQPQNELELYCPQPKHLAERQSVYSARSPETIYNFWQAAECAAKICWGVLTGALLWRGAR